MKVVIVGQVPEPGEQITGGVERVTATLASELANSLEVVIVSPGAQREGVGEIGGVEVRYLRRSSVPGVLRYWNGDALRVRTEVNRIKPDIVHIQAMAGWGLGLNCPAVLSLHGIVDRDLLVGQRTAHWAGPLRFFASKLIRFVEDIATDKLRHIIIINPYVVDALPQVNRGTLYCIPNPVDRAYLIDRSGPSVRDRSIMVIGRVGPLKNTAYAIEVGIEALRRDAEAKLVICGVVQSQEYIVRCKQLVSSANMQGRVEFTGNLPAEELVKRLDRASCLLMTSIQENAPLVISEAQARGVPVVAPKNFGIPYMIEEGVDGAFLTTNSIDEDASVLVATLQKEWDHCSISARARKRYSPESVAADTAAVYHSVLAGVGFRRPF